MSSRVASGSIASSYSRDIYGDSSEAKGEPDVSSVPSQTTPSRRRQIMTLPCHHILFLHLLSYKIRLPQHPCSQTTLSSCLRLELDLRLRAGALTDRSSAIHQVMQFLLYRSSAPLSDPFLHSSLFVQITSSICRRSASDSPCLPTHSSTFPTSDTAIQHSSSIIHYSQRSMPKRMTEDQS